MYGYDIECYPNVFLFGAIHKASNAFYQWEISDRVNEAQQIVQFLEYLHAHDEKMVGFNNLQYDYPVIHLLTQGITDCFQLYAKGQAIIDNQGEPWAHEVKPWQVFVPQVDLLKINHFDNKNRRVSLKDLEFNMRSDSIIDLPFAPGSYLTPSQIDELRKYHRHDIEQTLKFDTLCQGAHELRKTLTQKYEQDHTNFSDKKIGSKFFMRELEAAGVQCYTKAGAIQTHRDRINLRDIILPVIDLRSPAFADVHQRFLNTTVDAYDLDGSLKIKTDFNGVEFKFGLGGIHASIEAATVRSDDHGKIIDYDVTSYYPSVPIAWRFYPEHLTEIFCDVYADIKTERLKFNKGTPENKTMKLALNGAYGDSNNIYSPFYDPLYTVQVTVNGQLMLAMLTEQAAEIPGVRIIQANTDGITVYCPHSEEKRLEAVAEAWQNKTRLTLERVDYSAMFIRDVNNYIAVKMDGKAKRVGTYKLVSEMIAEETWHKDHSAAIVPIAASKYLIDGVPIEQTVRNHSDFFDFMIKVKHRKSDAVYHGTEKLQRVNRVYVTPHGESLTKIMPPLAPLSDEAIAELQTQRRPVAADLETIKRVIAENRKRSAPRHAELPALRTQREALKKHVNELDRRIRGASPRRSVVLGGHPVCVANNITDALMPIDYDYYIAEVKKITDVFG